MSTAVALLNPPHQVVKSDLVFLLPWSDPRKVCSLRSVACLFRNFPSRFGGFNIVKLLIWRYNILQHEVSDVFFLRCTNWVYIKRTNPPKIIRLKSILLSNCKARILIQITLQPCLLWHVLSAGLTTLIINQSNYL